MPQWSYPHAVGHDGNLPVVYAVTKGTCGLSIIPVHTLCFGAGADDSAVLSDVKSGG